MRNVRRRQVQQSRKRRQLAFVTFAVLLSIYLMVSLIIGENGLVRYMKLRDVRDKLLMETAAIEKQNKEMRNRIETLKKDPALIEEFAREYGLTKEGEIIFKFEDGR